MATQINAYLNFNGNCREAMSFYQECLGGELIFNTVEGSPMEAQCPAAMKNKILHSSLTNGSLLLMASDMLGHEEFIIGSSFSLSLNCSSEEEINNFYHKLSKDGQIVEPLKKQFWGALFTFFIDKFGVRWMLNYDINQK